MHKRQITLADGRYLIFYTFEDEDAPPVAASEVKEASKRPEPEARPEAEDERHV
ncbi:MAG TPA: hypothetical protein VF735_09810 [Pyrinomonadaceae bacterium]|jgi:hypothetical protein